MTLGGGGEVGRGNVTEQLGAHEQEGLYGGEDPIDNDVRSEQVSL